MSVTVLIPTALQGCVGNLDRVTLEGATVQDVLDRLAEAHAALRPHLLDDAGRLKDHVHLYVNDEAIRYLDQSRTRLADGDVVTIVPSVAGGQDGGTLSREEMERYRRHLMMPEVGLAGQMRLKRASVLCIGTGGLGSPLALYLAAAGVGRIGLVDDDMVDRTNLHRQILHGTSDVGRPKLASAEESLREINPHVRIDTHETKLSSGNALAIMEPYDIVVDGTDNFPARYLVNDACVLLGKPNIYGSIFRFEGQASVFWAKKGPCYRCLFPTPPPPGSIPSCAEGGVLGILPGVIGVIQATEAVKLIIGKGEPLIGRLLLYNALAMQFREIKLRKDPSCPVCGEHPTVTGLVDYQRFCGIETSTNADRLDVNEIISPEELKARLDRREHVLLLDVREPHEYDICRLPDARLLPLGELERRQHEIERDADIVVYCRSGKRSAAAVRFLKEAGFGNVKNMAGGLLAWSDRIDPSLPRY